MATKSAASRRCIPAALMAVALLAAALVCDPAPASAGIGETYTVRPGDTLSEIAQVHGLSTAELARANGISNLHLIRVGQTLQLPINVYRVAAGDTLSQIAVANGTTVSALMTANGLTNPDFIRAGFRLRIPDAAGATAAPAARYRALPARITANPERMALVGSFEKWAAHYGVPADLLMAMAYRESGWQQGVVSPAGAVGVGQLMPRTSDWLADELIRIPDLDPYVVDDNIRMSARFLAWLIGYMGSEDAAVAAYYQGPASVNQRGYYTDTTAYVANVQQMRRFFRAA